MDWFFDLFNTNSIAGSVIVLCMTISLGLAAGGIRIFGVSLGVGGVLFAGIFFGHLGFGLAAGTMEFVRDFGLMLFVYAIGLQVGPGFFASLRRQGLALNSLAAGIVLAALPLPLLLQHSPVSISRLQSACSAAL